MHAVVLRPPANSSITKLLSTTLARVSGQRLIGKFELCCNVQYVLEPTYERKKTQIQLTFFPKNNITFDLLQQSRNLQQSAGMLT